MQWPWEWGRAPSRGAYTPWRARPTIFISITRWSGPRAPEQRPALDRWFREKLESLLALQNDDGGFPDERAGVRKLDGWPGGYEEPQGLSTTFSTYFRVIAIAMRLEWLEPHATSFSFRRMVGIGYRDPRLKP